MISPERLQQSIDGYSIGYNDQTIWAPYVMNGIACRPTGDALSMPGGGKASPEQFRESALFAIDHLKDRGIEPTPEAVRMSLIDGSLPVEDSANYNYKGGVDCSAFAYFALKGAGVDVDNAILVPSSAVRHAAKWAQWDSDSPKLIDLVGQADNNALYLAEFVDMFYDTPEPQKNANTARFSKSSTAIDINHTQPGDLVIYHRESSANPNHIAVIKDVSTHGDLQLVHSRRDSWDGAPGGVEEFTIRHSDFANYYDRARGRITLKRLSVHM